MAVVVALALHTWLEVGDTVVLTFGSPQFAVTGSTERLTIGEHGGWCLAAQSADLGWHERERYTPSPVVVNRFTQTLTD